MTTETRLEVSAAAKSNAFSVAAEIASLVAAGKITVECRPVERVSLWGEGEVYNLGGSIRVAMDVRGETPSEISELLWLVRDAAQALKCKTLTVKKVRDGGRFASQPRYSVSGEVMDYFAKIVVILPG